MSRTLYQRVRSRFVRAPEQTELERAAFAIIERYSYARFECGANVNLFIELCDNIRKDGNKVLHRAYNETGYVCPQYNCLPTTT